MNDVSTFQILRELVQRFESFLYDGAHDSVLGDMDKTETEKLYFTAEDYIVIYKELIRRRSQEETE